MNDYEASTAPAPAHRYDRRDPDGRRYMAAVLGEPEPTTAHARQPRAFKATDASKATYSRPSANRSHRHYSRESES